MTALLAYRKLLPVGLLNISGFFFMLRFVVHPLPSLSDSANMVQAVLSLVRFLGFLWFIGKTGLMCCFAKR